MAQSTVPMHQSLATQHWPLEPTYLLDNFGIDEGGLFLHTLDSMAKLSGGGGIETGGPVGCTAVPKLHCENHRPPPQ